MRFMDRLLSQFIEVIEWTDPTHDTIVHRFPVNNNEIKMGAKLVVREGQTAVFVNEGQLADVFEPGTYTLSTQNMPVMTMLRSWPYGFNSPFKAEVYFISSLQFTDLKWGTRNPIMMRDAEFGMVRLRAFGSYAMKVADPEKLMKEIVGTDGHFTVDEISGQLRDLVLTHFANDIADLKVPVLDLAQNYRQVSEKLQDRLEGEFQEYGFDLTRFLIENISLPPEVEEMLDKRTSMGIVGAGDFTQFQAATALEAAAESGGGGGLVGGLSLGAGVAMGQHMASAITGAQQPAAPAPGPAAPAPAAPAVAQVACVSCSAQIDVGAKFCSGCGASQAAKSCPKCEAELEPGAKFCSECGEKIE